MPDFARLKVPAVAFMILMLGGILCACKKEQAPFSTFMENCDTAHEVNAEFKMEERVPSLVPEYLYTETDSIFGEKNVRFSALENNAEYIWYIGIEKLSGQSVTRFFPNSMVGQTVPISLVTKKKANTLCFPDDDGYDSIVKYLTVAQLNLYDNYDTTMLEGTYRMKSPLLADSVEITFDYLQDLPGRYFHIYNYDGQGSDCVGAIDFSDININYRQLWVLDGTGVNPCDYLRGDLHVPIFGPVEMNFTTGGYVDGVYNSKLYNWKYRGRKLS